jgi:hexosaminidase
MLQPFLSIYSHGFLLFRRCMIATLIMCMLLLYSSIDAQVQLLPKVQTIEYKAGAFRLDSDFQIKLPANVNEKLTSASKRWAKRVAEYSTLRIDWLDNLGQGKALTIQFNEQVPVLLGMDESYKISISDQEILLSAQSDIGVLRGLETLLQCLKFDSSGFYFPALEIQDQPRFPWRGLMIDACRHFIPVPEMLRILDGMAHYKLNVLHWHLSEDQGFRIESKLFPELHGKGSDGMFYTQDEVRMIVRYAGDRGIRVVPEFDIPGHATAWLVGYPHLASAPGPYKIERHFGVFDPTIDPTRKSTYQFLEKFIKEMSAIFPDPYFHIGGDENNGIQWDANPAIQAFMQKNKLKDNHALQNYFNQKVHTILKKNGKIMMGWDEILQPGLDTAVVIHSWRGKEFLVSAAKAGYQTVLSNGYYIDLSQAAAYHYLNDPLPQNSGLSKAEQQRILGGEATMWAELVDANNVESRIWPRTAAIAERLWSDARYRDTDDVYFRLAATEKWLELSGSNHRKNREYLIRRLSREASPEILHAFLDWVEPLEGYRRHGTAPRYTSYVPLSRPVDAALPDAPAAVRWRGIRAMHSDTAEWISVYSRDIERILAWHPVWKATFSADPVLVSLIPLADQLAEAAEAGKRMLQSIKNNKQSNQQLLAWRQMIAATKAPQAELEIILPDLLLEFYARMIP